MAVGTPEQVVTVERSYTGRYLRPLLEAKASAAPVAAAKPKGRGKAAKAKAIAAE